MRKLDCNKKYNKQDSFMSRKDWNLNSKLPAPDPTTSTPAPDPPNL